MSSTTNTEDSWELTPAIAKLQIKPLISEFWQWILYLAALVINDIVMTGTAFRVAYWIRFDLSLPIFKLYVEPSLAYYESLMVLTIPLWILVFAVTGLYQRQNLLGGTQEYAKFFRATTFGLLLVIVAGFLEPSLLIARGWILLAWFLTFLFGAMGRFLLRRVIYRLREQGYFMVSALIIGANEEARLLASQLMSWTKSGIHLRGVLHNQHPPALNGFPEGMIIGSLDQLDEIVVRLGIQEIILATSALSREEMLSIFQRYGVSSSINLRLSSGLFEIITTGLQVKELAYVPLVSVDKVRLKGIEWFMKLGMDYSLALLGLVLISPVLLVIAIAIKLDSTGSIIHRRRVMGLNGVKFDAFKFRTMYINGDEILTHNPELQEKLAQEHKLQNDPRITRVGKVLRKLSLDELPQLINILRGEMSLVGPRMISPEEMQKYDQWGLNLLTLKPGITGLWQVSGRSDVSYQERVRMDMYYIRNWNLWFDIYLLFQTIPAVLASKGAY
jgi:exopolysaccharide biosynthesis polyprenyl glycosylphosphotransferase